MRVILLIVLLIVLCFGCVTKNSSEDRKVDSYLALSEVEDNTYARDFANAIIGKWETVFTNPNGDNIKSAEFSPDGVVRLVVTRGNISEAKTGKYRIQFERKPSANMVTLGRIVVETRPGELVLSRVWFGDHNGVMFPDANYRPFLRVDKEPYGVMKRMANKRINSDN